MSCSVATLNSPKSPKVECSCLQPFLAVLAVSRIFNITYPMPSSTSYQNKKNALVAHRVKIESLLLSRERSCEDWEHDTIGSAEVLLEMNR